MLDIASLPAKDHESDVGLVRVKAESTDVDQAFPDACERAASVGVVWLP